MHVCKNKLFIYDEQQQQKPTKTFESEKMTINSDWFCTLFEIKLFTGVSTIEIKYFTSLGYFHFALFCHVKSIL